MEIIGSVVEVVVARAAIQDAAGFHAGQDVWLNGRAAKFLYPNPDNALSAVVRYGGEKNARVVRVDKLTSARGR